MFGSDIPFSEPSWYRGYSTPYYNESHKQFRAKIRNFVDTHLIPYISEWEEKQDYPRELHEKAYEAGIYGVLWPKAYGGTRPDDFDVYHHIIYSDEFARTASGGLNAALMSISIGLPPILAVGSEELKNRVAPEIIQGKKIIALAITESQAGSDVVNLETTAKRVTEAPTSPDDLPPSDVYVVNGQKKFITSGMKADYYTVAVRTGDKGYGSISLLLIDANSPGIKKTKLKTQGWWASNTAYLVFEDVIVPVSNLIGPENAGFLAIMLNFNNERFSMITQMIRFSRICIEESIKYARKRKTFGKRLIDHQVIRHKIAEMGYRVEHAQTRVEELAYQSKNNPNIQLAGFLALLKVQTSKNLEFCAREASQIFGGNSYIRGGLGEKIERIYREVRVMSIGGGSEEVMLDLAMKQARL